MQATEELKTYSDGGIEDPQFEPTLRKPIKRDGKLFISPFGVILGKNLSGASRADQVIHDKAFMAATQKFGVVQPVNVRRVALAEGKQAYLVVAGNRRTSALRHLIATGVIPQDDVRASMPIYEANEIVLDNVTPEDAANLLENAMRKRISIVDRAKAIDGLMKDGATVEEVGYLVTAANGKPLSRSSITQYRLIMRCHPAIHKALDDGQVTLGEASLLGAKPHEEQVELLQKMMEARIGAKNKNKAGFDVIRTSNLEKRKDKDGQLIYDPPRSGADIRRAFRPLKKVEEWDCVPKSSKLSNEGYKVVAEIFEDINTWLEGGLTPKNCDPEKLTLTLKTRILAAMARLAPR
jgi:hypothetical protein